MKYYLFTTLFSLFMMTGQANGFRPEIAITEMGLESIDVQIERSRENLTQLTHDDAIVLERFDRFTELLLQLCKEDQLSVSEAHQVLIALNFAAKTHQFQMRKNKTKTPYISHPIGVANYVMEIGGVTDPSIIMAALLHDTLDDTIVTPKELKELFGSEVYGYVRELTDDKSLSKEQRKRLQVIHAAHRSPGAAQVKLADKLYNLSDLLNFHPEGWSVERVDRYFEWAEAVINRLPPVNPALKDAVTQVIEQYWAQQED